MYFGLHNCSCRVLPPNLVVTVVTISCVMCVRLFVYGHASFTKEVLHNVYDYLHCACANGSLVDSLDANAVHSLYYNTLHYVHE